MSFGIVGLNANPADMGYRSPSYGQGYGNYQNQQSAGDKTAANYGQYSMGKSANSRVDPNADMLNPAEQAGKSDKNKKVGDGECQTCNNRKYHDVSDDSGVSYQTPTKISSGQAAAAVSAHEQEHVVRNQAKAKEEGRRVLSQSVMIHSAICPECGKSYVSGGTTRTVTAGDNVDENQLQSAEAVREQAAAEKGIGTKLNTVG